jgi:hypothetical protein
MQETLQIGPLKFKKTENDYYINYKRLASACGCQHEMFLALAERYLSRWHEEDETIYSIVKGKTEMIGIFQSLVIIAYLPFTKKTAVLKLAFPPYFPYMKDPYR